MKKKIIAIVAVFAVIALLFVAYGCGKSNLEPEAPVVTSVSAAETTQPSSFNFEEVYSDDEIGLTIYHETKTDTLFVTYHHFDKGWLQTESGGLTQMMDPETGLPLTYTVWQENYAS